MDLERVRASFFRSLLSLDGDQDCFVAQERWAQAYRLGILQIILRLQRKHSQAMLSSELFSLAPTVFDLVELWIMIVG